jgi:hypothetical protein
MSFSSSVNLLDLQQKITATFMHRYNLKRGGQMPPPLYFLPNNSFCGYRVEEGEKKSGVRVGGGGKVCMHNKDSFKPLFPLFLI